MIPKNITFEHVLKALIRIDEKGIEWPLTKSKKYDLVYNDKTYPPKLVIMHANEFAGNEELSHLKFNTYEAQSYLKKLNPDFVIIEKNESNPIFQMITNYKNLIQKNGFKDELYKWELIEKYQGRPNLQTIDFYEEIKSIDYSNLMYYNAMNQIKEIAKGRPEELRLCFKALFDEQIDLASRIKAFIEETDNLFRILRPDEKLSHYQDERTIATYLCYYNPEKYTFYKDSFYKKYCKLLGIKPQKMGEKFIHYLKLIDELINEYVVEDEELLKLYKLAIPEELFQDSNYKLLAQDILYRTMDKQPAALKYWIFQGNPDKYDFETAIKGNLLDAWTITAHKETISIGDNVIIWITGNKAGCYALARVVSLPVKREVSADDTLWKEENNNDWMVSIKITHNFFESPVYWSEIKNMEVFKEMKVGNQGTNFTATEKEYQTILELAEGENQPFQEVIKHFDKKELDVYFDFLEKICKSLDIKIGDTKVVYSCRAKQLSFTVGQRYCWFLIKRKVSIVFGSISKDPFVLNSTQFEGKEPRPYFNEFTDYTLLENNANQILEAIKSEYDKTFKSGFLQYNNQDFEHYAFYRELKEKSEKVIPKTNLIMHPLNQILYGPPGTGKTYNTVNKAIAIVNPLFDLKQERTKIKEEYSRLVNEGQIVFATFHQSMSYEDFIEGIKPVEPEKEGDPVIYRIEYGIFRNISIVASFAIAQLRDNKTTEEVLDFSFLYDNLVEGIEEKILNGQIVELATKNGGSVLIDSISQQGNIIIKHHDGLRTYTVSKARLTKLQSAIKNLDEVSNINDKFREIIGGSNASAYWSVLNALRKEKTTKTIKKAIRNYTFEEKKEVVLSLTIEDYKNINAKSFVLIIDEINRGNVSQIFGELITLIEEDKRLGNDEALEVTLPYSKEKFGVPPNLYIIGTMNTADRSVEALDTALRRRFSFEEMQPNPGVIATDGKLKDKQGILDNINLPLLLKIINQRIEKLLDKDHQIGHSYLMSVQNIDDLKLVFHNKIIPLLQEYFFGDYGKIGLVVGEGFFEKIETEADKKIFAKFDDYDADEFAEKPIYKLWNTVKMSAEDFTKAINLLMQ